MCTEITNGVSPGLPRPVILAYCKPWHVNKSDAFVEILVKPLAPWLDVRLTPWDGISVLPVPSKGEAVCFLQLPPPLQDIDWRQQPLTWIPMFDQLATHYKSPRWWRSMPRQWRILSFSPAVTQFAETGGRSVMTVKYWRDPAELEPARWDGARMMYYWNRLGLVGPQFLEKLCASLKIDRLLFRADLDPQIPAGRYFRLPEKLGSTVVEELQFSKEKETFLFKTAAANVLLAPRPIEGVGLLSVDALARGCAVLAVDLPTANEYIRDGQNGCLLTSLSGAIGRRGADSALGGCSGLLASAATWWGGEDGYFLSDKQDWTALKHTDWSLLGAQARKDSELGAKAWKRSLPEIASFLRGEDERGSDCGASSKNADVAGGSVRADATVKPLVSICLPHLDSMPFTHARLSSILAQTWQEWECIVVDSGSTDGSREIIEDAIRRDSRIRLVTQARQGIYAAFNESIRHASGDFIYIATADDTMEPRGLERMVDGLLKHPDCGACHAQMILIDEQGDRISGRYEKFAHARYFGEWMDIPHIRRHPYDAVLSSLIAAVYVSVTQMLYRRSVVDRTGPFPATFGSGGDFAWQMRMAATTDILYLPEVVATWRQHAQQATQPGDPVELSRRIYNMVRSSADSLFVSNPQLKGIIDPANLGYSHRLNTFRLAVNSVPAYRLRAMALLREVVADPGILRCLRKGSWGSDMSFQYDYVSEARSFMSESGMDRLIEATES